MGAKVIGYDDWMRRTNVFAARRSPQLVTVDEALKAYGRPSGASPANLSAVKKAFEAWKLSKGVDWRKSDRNRDKVCEQLEAELHGPSRNAPLSVAEIEAIKEVERANAMNLDRMFRSRQLQWKSVTKSADVSATRTSLTEFKKISSAGSALAGRSTSGGLTGALSGTLAPAKQAVETFLKTLFDELDLSHVVAALGPIIDEIVAAVTPYIGMVTGGVKALAGWGTAAKLAYQRSGHEDRAGAFAPGDPSAAFDAVLRIIDRELIQTVRKATTETVATLTQGVFTLVDFGALSGPLLGAAKALANLTARIYLLARDYREVKAANALLKLGALNLELFKINPLLGCYIVACSDTSAVINMAVADYGKPGWKFEVEDMVSRVQPLLIKASQFLRASRFEIPELATTAGALRYKLDKTLGMATGKLDRAIDTSKAGFLLR